MDKKVKKLVEKWVKIYDELIVLNQRKIDHHKSELRRYERELKKIQQDKENFIREYQKCESE
jgi:hypothetical protein